MKIERRWTPEIEQDLVNGVISIEEAAHLLGVNRSTVAKHLRVLGKQTPRQALGRGRPQKRLPEEVLQFIVDLTVNQNASLVVAYRRATERFGDLGAHPSTVYREVTSTGEYRAMQERKRQQHLEVVDYALQRYLEGASLSRITTETGVSARRLYNEIYRRGIPLRVSAERRRYTKPPLPPGRLIDEAGNLVPVSRLTEEELAQLQRHLLDTLPPPADQ